jgi:hypothetical protein
MHATKAGMKAAFVCDFYMTKYHAKAQQILSPAIAPMLQGLRRLEAEEAVVQADSSVRERALRKLRRLMFAANKSHWYSAAELAIFVLTGGHSISTHADKVLFTSRPHYMLQECKRLLTGEADAGACADSKGPVHVDMLQVVFEEKGSAEVGPQALDDGEDDDCDATPANSEQEDATEEPAEEAEIQVFRATTSNRDDWLHRGSALVDVDWYCYVKCFERVKLPKSIKFVGVTTRYFPFEKHYCLSKEYCQALRRVPTIVPRTVGPQCLQVSVDGGEPNALYKATLFTPLRCMGPEHCADVQHCSPALFPDSRGKFSFRSAWKARRAHIEILADSGQGKTDRAKRIAVIKDTTAFKAWELQSPGTGELRSSQDRVLVERCVILILLRVAAGASLGEMHLNLERPLCLVLEWLDIHTGRHRDQLFLAEYVALKARNVLFHIDLDADARNTVVVQAKKLAGCIVEDDEEPQGEIPKMELEDVGGAWGEEDELSDNEREQRRGSIAEKIYDWGVIEKLLCRDAEIKATEAPGRHADAHKNMRDYARIFGARMRRSGKPRQLEPAFNLRFEESASDILAKQRENAEAVRAFDLQVEANEFVTDAAMPVVEVSEARATAVDLAHLCQGPAHVARGLAEKAGFNDDQLRLVALFAYPMQQQWEKQVTANPQLADPASSLWTEDWADVPVLDLAGVIARVLFTGGGGCGKSRVITQVLTPLLKVFYGRRGVMIEAASNKAARGVGGITLHAANKLMGSSSLITVNLRTKPKQKAAMQRYGRLGAKLFDEFSQLNAKLFHADAYCTAMGRSGTHKKVDTSRYADYDQTWGALPIVGVGGDELQLPPVPMQAGLFAPIEGTSHEQKAAVKILNSFTHVYRLTTAMRFQDDVLRAILRKMRQKGGCTLLKAEWDALLDTEISGPTCPKLAGTEMWYEAAYEWSIVSMAQAMRSQMSAEQNRKTLFAVQAEDEYLSALDNSYAAVDFSSDRLRRNLSTAVLNHPNMNETGRLPSFCLFHVGMKMRVTQTTESGVVVTDATGTVCGVDFDEREPRDHREAAELSSQPLVVLKHLPVAIYLKLDEIEGVQPHRLQMIAPRPCPQHAVDGLDADCPACHSCRNVVAVTPYTNKSPWTLNVKLDCGSIAKVKVQRRQMPLVCLAASTLHVLQGCTCDLGLIFHWKFPRRLSGDLIWLAVYVAISRVRRLANFRSVGLTDKIRTIIESGPPDSIPAQFETYFAQKEVQTEKLAREYVHRLGWKS